MPIDSAACGSSAMARSEMPTRVLLKKIDSDDQDAGGGRRHQIELADLDVAEFDRCVDDTEIEFVDARSHRDLGQSLDHERKPEGRHEQRDLRLVDQRTQHDALHGNRDRDHDRKREQRGKPEVDVLLAQGHEGQGGAQHHRALGEVENAGRLEDQHEADRDQRIHHARQQAADQSFDKEVHDVLNAPRRDKR